MSISFYDLCFCIRKVDMKCVGYKCCLIVLPSCGKHRKLKITGINKYVYDTRKYTSIIYCLYIIIQYILKSIVPMQKNNFLHVDLYSSRGRALGFNASCPGFKSHLSKYDNDSLPSKYTQVVSIATCITVFTTVYFNNANLNLDNYFYLRLNKHLSLCETILQAYLSLILIQKQCSPKTKQLLQSYAM